MKKRPLILLFILAVICFAFVACDTAEDVKSFVVKDLEKTEYSVGETIDYDSILLEITYKTGDTATKTVKAAGAKISKYADLGKAGNTYFIVELHGFTRRVNITVVGEAPKTNVRIETFSLPFWTQYNNRSTATTGDSAFKTQGATYEVGNVNKFVVEPRATGLDGGTRVTYSTDVKTVPTVLIASEANGPYTLMTGEDRDEYVTIDGNSYQFTAAAAGKYVKLTVALDSEVYDYGDIIDSYTLNFKVVDGGYNVYNQAGLAVATDLLLPELWADILGCEVENGAYVPTDNPLKLTSDDRPLYTYIGNVDWLILHGTINVTADNLPEKYFLSSNGENKSGYDSAYGFISANAPDNMKSDMLAQLDGSLYDGYGAEKFNTCKVSRWNTNYQKGLYASGKVSISGNYNSITVDNSTVAGKRKIKTVAAHNMDEKGEDGKPKIELMTNWWSLFKLCSVDVDNTFTVKNAAFKGNTGRTENLGGAQGIAMLNASSDRIELDNINADSFYSNLNHDVYGNQLQNQVSIANCKIKDIYNTMAVTWRGNINIVNSSIKDCGGPLFILDDGEDNIAADPTRAYPRVTYDEASELEAFANGTESWYKSLGGNLATGVFLQLQAINNAMEQLSGKSFFHAKSGAGTDRGYASIIGLLMPEAGSAFSLPDDGKHEWQQSKGTITTPQYTYESPDATLQALLANPTAAAMGLVIFKSGDNYAMVTSINASTGQVGLANPTLFFAHYTGQISDEQYAAATAQWQQAWQDSTLDTLTVWMQMNRGVKTSPFLQILFGSFYPDQAAA